MSQTKQGYKNRHSVVYIDLDSTCKPVPQCETLSVPIPPEEELNSTEDEVIVSGLSSDSEYEPEEKITPTNFTKHLNNLIRYFSKYETDILASRLKETCLRKNVTMNQYRKRDLDLTVYLKLADFSVIAMTLMGFLKVYLKSMS